ncbi:hypothetical protein E2C01_090442 [Portunus trituberculatus]|uniref:Uncharacterized protein n=1 Tax=Portunus trituberculatus TaxID=210409 RepID=A0A5B7JEQ3_PORTR|nr:hypothetical protein [Portunus trituberculatus]
MLSPTIKPRTLHNYRLFSSATKDSEALGRGTSIFCFSLSFRLLANGPQTVKEKDHTRLSPHTRPTHQLKAMQLNTRGKERSSLLSPISQC